MESDNSAIVTEPRPFLCGIYKSKPLTDEEINKLYMEYGNKNWEWQIDFARAIERRHGIK